ncbi:hypothetical protein HanRHA438_Chr15g0694011 [Helianthus annuus]|nr:hypothetical protein HanRHA438_Chr15g0694011 [Helianthus annuus]
MTRSRVWEPWPRVKSANTKFFQKANRGGVPTGHGPMSRFQNEKCYSRLGARGRAYLTRPRAALTELKIFSRESSVFMHRVLGQCPLAFSPSF